MRLLFLLTILLTGKMAFGQGTTTAEYYQYQRDQEFKKYMENVSSKGMASPANSNFDYSIDKKALQEMAEMWDRRAGRKTAAQIEAERAEAKKKRMAQEEKDWENSLQRQQLALKADARKAWANQVTYRYVEYFNKVGLESPDVPMMALNWVQEVMVNGQPDIEEVYHERSEMAAKAFQQFKRREQTAGFEELVGLVADFDMAGYTAIKSLEKLKIRFPEKAQAIDILMPFHGTTFWQTLGRQSISFNSTMASSFTFASEEQRKEMNTYLVNWLKTTPGIISVFKSDKEAIDNLVSYAIDKKDKTILRALMVSAALYEPEIIKWINVPTERLTDPDITKFLTMEDLETIRKFHGITGFEAVQMVNDRKFIEAIGKNRYGEGYDDSDEFWYDRSVDYLKWFADAGDLRALNVYALFTLLGKTADKKDAAYTMFKKAMDGGVLYPRSLLKEPSVNRKLGINDWGRYLRELEFTYVEPWIIKEYMSDKTKPLSEQKMKIEFAGKPDKTIYYFGQIKDGMANGKGYGLMLDGFTYAGDWVNNQFHGYGTLDGGEKWEANFTGFFKNGKKNGYDQKKGDGHYEDDKKHWAKQYKKLEFTDPISGYRVKYNGQIENGKANGYGNAEIYDGNWSTASYQGFWKDNIMHGFAYLKKIIPGSEYKGEFYKGKFIQKRDVIDNDSILLLRQVITGQRVAKTASSPNFDKWKSASENFEWLALESPVDDENCHRYLKNGVLVFNCKSNNYHWGITPLTGQQFSDYTYEAEYVVRDTGMQGECGLLIDINENNGGSTTKLIFLIKPGAQSFYLGTYNPDTYKWTSFTSPNANGGWVNATAIKTFSENREANNKLTLKKTGNNIALYANDMLLYTLKITDATSYLHRFAGVGIIQAGKAAGYMPAIRFSGE